MPAVEQQIAQQREAIERAKKQALELAKRREITRRELLRRGITEVARARGEQIRRRKIAQARLKEIAKVEEPFEKAVEKYEMQKRAYEARVRAQAEKRRAYEIVLKFYNKGMLGAILRFGSPTEKRIAKEFCKKGASLGRELEMKIDKPELQVPGTYDPKTGSYISPERNL